MVESRHLFGRERRLPCPKGYNGASERVRWQVMADGLKAVIEMHPVKRSFYVRRLQELWAYCCYEEEKLGPADSGQRELDFIDGLGVDG